MATEPESAPVVRVLVVDDHALFSAGLELVLGPASSGRVEVVGSAHDVDGAVANLRRLHPDVVVLDWVMPADGGPALLEVIRTRFPATGVLVVSGVDDLDALYQALAAGADGYLPKSADPSVLGQAIVLVSEHCCVVPREMLSFLTARCAPAAAAPLPDLDDEDRALLRMLARGMDTRSIARTLYVSERTAKRRIATLLRRIGVTSRAEAAALAGRLGDALGDP